MPDYAVNAVLFVVTPLIVLILVLRGITARLDTRIRALRFARARIHELGAFAASAPFALDPDSSETLRQSDFLDDGSGSTPPDLPYRRGSGAEQTLINPATGLAMVGAVNLARNLYGFDNSTIGCDAAFLFEPAGLLGIRHLHARDQQFVDLAVIV
jgi:hypothetical protein